MDFLKRQQGGKVMKDSELRMIETMLKKQDELNSAIMKEFGLTTISKEQIDLATLDEIGEFTHELKGDWCWWKKSQEPVDRNKALEELADIFHFVLIYELLYGKRELLNKMSPFLMGGDMIEYVYEQDTTFAPLPNKFEAGTQNVEGVVGLGAAIDYINSIGYEKIQEIENEVVNYAREELSKLGFLKLYMTPNKENHSSVISFNIEGVHPHDVASILDSEGVCVRSGNHCAQPLLRYMGIDSTCRASFYFYNTKEDVDRLIMALKKAYKMFEKYIITK